ncbi:MAG TPA: hypothetical protein VFB79_12035 [Candidatus Angelobacter sp.]|nr:hypothetical protein [Candidatus Angelobacter sp.]
MPGLLKKLALLVAITTVLVVFIAPSVDLPDTTLAAKQNAQIVMLCITLLVIAFSLELMLLFRRWTGKADLFLPVNNLIQPFLCTFLL